MVPDHGDRECFFQVWIVRSKHWRPEAWNQAPPQAAMVRPIGICNSARLAAAWVEGFNQEVMVRTRSGLWAVAAPVKPHFEGAFASKKTD